VPGLSWNDFVKNASWRQPVNARPAKLSGARRAPI
jgi:hypothetical protein